MQEGLEKEGVALYPSGELKQAKGSTLSAPYTGLSRARKFGRKDMGLPLPTGAEHTLSPSPCLMNSQTPWRMRRMLSSAARSSASMKQAAHPRTWPGRG